MVWQATKCLNKPHIYGHFEHKNLKYLID